MNNATVKGGALVRIQIMMCQLPTHHPTDGVDEVAMVEVFKTVLIGIVSVGSTIEIVSGRVLDAILITSILQNIRIQGTMKARDLLGIPLH